MEKNEIVISSIVGGGYDDFWRDKSRYRVLMGGKASKKSTTTALNLILRLMNTPGANLLVVRAIYNTHRDSTFSQLRWAQDKLGVAHLWQNTVSPLEMTFVPTGQKILFRGFDDPLKLASTTVPSGYLCWVWIEEAYEIKSEADFDVLDLSVPRGDTPIFKQTTLTFNPWSQDHWLKKRFFDSVQPGVSTYRTTYLCNEFLDDTDRAVFDRMREINPRKYQVAGLGEWGVADGLVYDAWEIVDFDDSITEEKPWEWRLFCGLDFGYTHDPTAFVAFYANPITKEIYILDEIYERKMLNSDIAARIKAKGYAKERIRADAAEPKSIDDLRRLGISRIQPSVKGADSILNGISAIKEYKIHVHPRCVNTIAELRSYRYEDGREKPVDEDNHAMDALRYGFYDVRFFSGTKPERQRKDYTALTPDLINGGWD